jgi:uridylate kinase
MDKFHRVLIKISGEALAGAKKTGYDFELITSVCEVLKRASEQGTQIAIVIGGGNFWRGVKDGAGKIERVNADRMGMLATCMNCIAVCDVLRQLGAKARVMTAVDIMGVGERYDTRRAIEYLEAGEIVLFAGGSGAPFFSTDTAAALRAAEIHADAILLAKNVDGVYDSDPNVNPAAVKFDRISYAEVLARRLAVMDTAATALAMENDLPVAVFALKDPENILRVLAGENVGTIVE